MSEQAQRLSDAELERMKAQLAAGKTEHWLFGGDCPHCASRDAAPANMAALIGEVERLRAENEKLRYFADEVVWGHLEFDKEHQCPWCLYVYRGYDPTHNCLVVEMLPLLSSAAEWHEPSDARD